MTNINRTSNIEHLHDDVFGKTFAMYDKQEMERFIEPFKIRFERNKLDPKKIFHGKKCLDAGAGNGRGSIFMAMHGAAEIIALDVSPTNVESIKRNAALFGFADKISPQLSSLENIPFADESFDFVWCNGVLMHTHNPDKCLQELSRVLKVGGQSWIYVYGSGGVYWYCVYKFREMLKNFSEEKCIQAMELAQIPVQFLAEYMDDWKAPYLRTYTDSDFSNRLKELGFTDTYLQPFGTDYDTSHRINTFSGDKLFVGEGDLRYLLTKSSSNIENSSTPISDSVYGSDYQYPKQYTDIIDEKMNEIQKLTNDSLVLKVLSCAYIQRHLRDDIFDKDKPFEMSVFVNYFEQLINSLKAIKG